jgi:hypothetical protein
MAVLNMSVDFRYRHAAPRGRSGSLLGAKRLRGLPRPAFPAGVSCLPLQSTEWAKSTISFNTAKKIEKQTVLAVCFLEHKTIA